MPYRKPKQKKTYRKPKSDETKKIEQRMKTISLKQCETKVASRTEENLQCTHNGTYYVNNLLFTSQGTGDPQGLDQGTRSRIGDEIILRGIKFKWWCSNKGDRPNVMYNIYVFWYNTLETPTNSTFWRGTDGVGGTMNRMLDNPNPERIKVLKKITILSTNQYVGTAPNLKEHSYYRECYIPLNNKKLLYRRDSSGVPKGMDIGFVVTTYDAYGTLTSDTIASFAYSKTLYFKDP